MADIRLQSVNGQDGASLRRQPRAAFGQALERQAEQNVVMQQQVRHAALRQRRPFLLQLMMNFGARTMFPIA
jgi:hypothetical protein